MKVNSVCLCVFVLSSLFEFGHSNSPCPDIFNFVTDDDAKVFGQITLKPVGQVSFVKLRFTFQAVRNDSGVHIIGPDDILGLYNRGETIRYRVNFSVMSPRPKITEITVNDEKICTGPRYPNLCTISVEHNVRTVVIVVPRTTPQPNVGQEVPGNSASLPAATGLPVRNTTSPEYHDSEECGVVAAGNNEISPLVHNGLSYERGEIPWLVAIYKKAKKTLQFICGGTLVSNRHVVTAAHCMGSRVSLSEKDIVVKLGVHDLNAWSDDIVVTEEVMAATFHESFNSSSLKNDIIILTLNRRVGFNNFIRPACLWSGNNELSLVVGATGVVAGWGEKEVDEPHILRVPIVSAKECRTSMPDLQNLTSHNTLCAGSRDGSGPCTGDSGGGLYLLDGGKWRLRGIVSHVLQNGNRALPCNLNEYVVYTDAAQYLPWIINVLSQKYFD